MMKRKTEMTDSNDGGYTEKPANILLLQQVIKPRPKYMRYNFRNTQVLVILNKLITYNWRFLFGKKDLP
jgi:hypothetical protein